MVHLPSEPGIRVIFYPSTSSGHRTFSRLLNPSHTTHFPHRLESHPLFLSIYPILPSTPSFCSFFPNKKFDSRGRGTPHFPAIPVPTRLESNTHGQLSGRGAFQVSASATLLQLADFSGTSLEIPKEPRHFVVTKGGTEGTSPSRVYLLRQPVPSSLCAPSQTAIVVSLPSGPLTCVQPHVERTSARLLSSYTFPGFSSSFPGLLFLAVRSTEDLSSVFVDPACLVLLSAPRYSNDLG